MNTMTLENFVNRFNQKSDFVLEENGYNMHITFFENDYAINDDDCDYFVMRAEYWKENHLHEGSEPFFWPDKMQVAGVIRYGALTD